MERVNLEKKQIDLIRESICVYTVCIQCGNLYKEGRLYFSSIEDFVDDRGKSCLFRLKGLCHELFRNADEASYKEKLYDMTVGYIFHEAMKLRENLYQLEYYKPWSGIEITSDNLTELERKIVHEMETLEGKARRKLKEGFKETKILLKELIGQLKDLIVLYRDNYLLPRFLFENEKMLIRIFGKKEYSILLNGMYEDGRATLIFEAAQSYLQSEYFVLARNLFRKILGIDKQNRRALFFYLYTSAFDSYYKGRYRRAQIFMESALDVKLGDDDKIYKESFEKLNSDLRTELGRIQKKRRI